MNIIANLPVWPFTIVAALIAILGAFAVQRFIAWRSAAAVFRAPFNDIVLNLRENPDLPSAQIARINYHAILSAAQQFRPHVHCLRKKGFDRAVAQYKEACAIASENGSVLAVASSEKTEFAKAKRKVLDDAVHKLLSYGKIT